MHFAKKATIRIIHGIRLKELLKKIFPRWQNMPLKKHIPSIPFPS